MKQKNILILEKISDIVAYLEDKSDIMCKYVKETTSNFTLIRKFITHSDLPTFGKRTDKKQDLSKNILYYLALSEMIEIESREGRKFEVAKQSNISVPGIFFKKLGIEPLERRKGQQKQQHSHILINDYAKVFLVNDTLQYFSKDYTKKILDKLGKELNPKYYNFDIFNEKFIPIELRHAIHGIGTKEDILFHKLRGNIFKNDALILLIEETSDGNKKIFILLEKNPRFFSLINETNKVYENYLLRERKRSDKKTCELIEDEKTRKFQSLWREKLAEEMMNYTTEDEKIFCPFTLIEASFDTVGTLYRASHIKPFSECDLTEAFDINNGLLLVANADALFDKYLITVSENKELIFSFLIKQNGILLSKLLLNNQIFKNVLNSERMKYLEYHRKIFYKKEEERKRQ